MTFLTTLEQAAAERERARAELEAARLRCDELKPQWDAALAAVGAAQDELRRIDLGMTSVKRAHMIGKALEALGVEPQRQIMYVVPARSSRSLPEVFELTAVGPTGVGLYVQRKVSTTDRGKVRVGKTFALHVGDVPEAVFAAVAQLDALPSTGSTAERDSAYEALEAATARGARYTIRRVHGSGDLMYWQAHSKGDFGYNGALRQLPPPGGGKWRWLKIEEQAELDGGQVNGAPVLGLPVT